MPTFVCDGKCEEHYGEICHVNVSYLLHDWGEFWYCEQAIANDRDNGFTVTLLDDEPPCQPS